MQEFQVPRAAIQEQAAIDIEASPEQVAAIYRDVERWDETFPATIESAHVTASGENWKEIEVKHKQEGSVPNTLIDLSPTEIGLKESKPRFDATFLNRFERRADGGTHYVIQAYVSPRGIYKLLKPFLAGYVRRQALKQMTNYVLLPLKAAADKDSQRDPTGR